MKEHLTVRSLTDIPVRILLQRGLFIFAGILLYSLSLNTLLAGNHIAAGGISGIATVLSGIIPLRIGTIVFLINIPILLAALLMKGWRFAAGTIITAAVYSTMLDLLSFLPTITDDPLTAAVFGGVLYGFGMAAITIGRGSTGGTDLLSRLLVMKFPNMRVGRMSLYVDGFTVLFAVIAYHNLEVALYAIVTIIVCSFVADRLMMNIDRAVVCMLVTQNDVHEIADPLMKRFSISATALSGTGLYTNTEKNVILLAINPGELNEFKKCLREEDPGAFLIVLPASELVGGHLRPQFHRP